MIAKGEVSLTHEEIKLALIEFVERHGFVGLYPKAMEQNVNILFKTERKGNTGGMAAGWDVTTFSATVSVEAKKK